MSTNPYAPPAARIEEAARPQVETPYFAVSLPKLLILSLCTFRLYEVYWFYRNWQRVKERDREKISPVWRSILPVFFCYSLFSRIREDQRKARLGAISAGALAAGWILLAMTRRLPEPYELLSLAPSLFLLPVQHAVNRINAAAAPGHDRNGRFSLANWCVVLVGGAFLLLVMIGLLLGDLEG